MASHHVYDVIIIGGGAIGLSAAYNLASRPEKPSVLVLEQFSFFNDAGSSNDVCRFYRTAYSEEYMMKLAYDTYPLWQDLEKEAAETLVYMCGLLNFGDSKYTDGPEGNLVGPIENFKKLGKTFENLTCQEVEKKLGMKNLSDIPNFVGFFAPDNGVINVQKTLRTMYAIAQKAGVQLEANAPCDHIKVHDDGVQVSSKNNVYHGKKVILTAGAYTNTILKPSFGLEINMDIWEMIYAYYPYNKDISPMPYLWFQIRESKDHESDLFYGIPECPWSINGHARIAVDYASVRYKNYVKQPRPLNATEKDLKMTRDFIAHHLPGVQTYPGFSGSCLAANAPDNNLILDFVPETNQKVALFACGWGFKFVPMLGKLLTQMVLDGGVEKQYQDTVANFRITRKGVLNDNHHHHAELKQRRISDRL